MSLTVVPDQGKEQVHLNWPNRQTASTSALIATNLLSRRLQHAPYIHFGLNVPLRIFSFGQAIYYKRTYKVFMDGLVVGSWLCPYTTPIALGIDALSEMVNFWLESGIGDKLPTAWKDDEVVDKPAPKTLEEAGRILGLKNEELQDQEAIITKYQIIKVGLEERVDKSAVSGNRYFPPRLQALLTQNRQAFELLMQACETERASEQTVQNLVGSQGVRN